MHHTFKTTTIFLKRPKGIKWNTSLSCWYLPLSKESYLAIKEKTIGTGTLETSALKKYLQQRKAVQPVSGSICKQRANIIIQHPFNQANLEAFTRFQAMLQLKGYSPSTLKTYCCEFHRLLRLLGTVAINDLTKQHIMSYLLWLMTKRKYSESHVHTAVNALKFYFEQVEKRPREFYDLPRPKKPVRLPSILAEEEMVSLIQNTENIKHRALLMTAYSTGLRVSELVGLKIAHVDSKRMMILIEQGKAKKIVWCRFPNGCWKPFGCILRFTGLNCTSLREITQERPSAPEPHSASLPLLNSGPRCIRKAAFIPCGTAMRHIFWKAAQTYAT
jgi:hypothetical protein